MRTQLMASIVVAAVVGITGCANSTPAYGDQNSIVAAMSPDIWNKASDDIYAALEPTIYTVRKEKTFTVTYQDPTRPDWSNLKRFRLMLLVGTGNEPWMQDAVKKSRTPINGPGLYTAYDVWASGQQVTMVILSSPDSLDQLRAHLPEINKALDTQYRQWVHNRMFMSGVDTALSNTLMTQAGFSLTLPSVYQHANKDSVWIFRNDQPDPSELIRQVAVTWRTPIPATPYGPADIMKWRAELVTNYHEGQLVDTSDVQEGPFKYQGLDGYQIQATWKEPPEYDWPAAGPFIVRTIACPSQNREYLVDAWLYAPGKEKYQYMIQLEDILNSFKCK